jgi:hypothetical protein
MKYLLFFLILSFFAFSTVVAQIDYGLKAGLHFSQVDEVFDGRDLSTTAVEDDAGDVLLKPQLGVWFSIPLSERLSLQPELLWTQKAWNQIAIPTAGKVLTFNYFSLPLAITYQTGSWRFTLGPELTYLHDSYFRKGSPFYSNSRENPYMETKEFGLAVNLGLQYHCEQWVFGLRASRDLTKIPTTVFTDANGEPVEGFQHYHQGMTLWAGYALSK